MITKEEMLNYYKENLPTTLNDFTNEVKQDFLTHIEKVFEYNDFELFMKILSKRLENNKSVVAYSSKGINLKKHSIPFPLFEGNVLGGLLSLSQESLQEISYSFANETVFGRTNPYYVIIDSSSSKEEIMSALYHSNYLGFHFLPFDKNDYIVEENSIEELALLKKYNESYMKNMDLYDGTLQLLKKIQKQSVFRVEKVKKLNSNYLDLDITQSISNHIAKEKFAKYRTPDGLKKLLEEKNMEEVVENTNYVLTNNRIIEMAIQIKNRNIIWNKEDNLNLLLYLENINQIKYKHRIKISSYKEDVQYVINDYIENHMKNVSLNNSVLIANEILSLIPNLRNNKRISKEILQDLSEKMKNESFDETSIKFFDNKMKKNKYKEIYDEYHYLLEEKNDIVVIKERDIRIILSNFKTPLEDLIKNIVDNINGNYCVLYQLKKDLILETQNNKNGKELNQIDLESVFLKYLEQSDINKIEHFDQYLRTKILKSKLKDENQLTHSKKKI